MEANGNKEKAKNLGDESLNPRKEALTIEKLRTFDGFENTSDEEALEIIATIDTLCRIMQEYLMNENNNENKNQQNLAA